MRQLYIFIMQYLFIMMCEQIDTAFINNVSMDAICIFSAFCPLMWTVNQIRNMGIEGYRVLRKNRMNCFVLCTITSLVSSVLCVSLSGIIPEIYSITDLQKELLTKCLFMEGIGLVFQGMEHFIHNWLLLECRNKEAIKYDITLYIMMIASDLFVFMNKFSVEYFMLATTICYFIQVVIMCMFTDFLVKERISMTILKEATKHASRLLIDGLVGKVATMFYNIFASKLGTELYAIHAICYNICTQEEAISVSAYTFTLTHLKKTKGTYTEAWEIIKKNLIKLIYITYITAGVLLVLTHGSVSIWTCVPYLIVYVSDIIALIFYEVFKGYLVTHQKTFIVKNGGIVGVFIRIPTVIIGYYCGLGVWGFALPCLIDFSVRAIYFERSAYNNHKRGEE